MIVKHCRRALVPVLGLALLLVSAQQPPAADGIGRAVITPNHVMAGSTNTFTLVFSADVGALEGQTLIDVPRGWSPPQTTRPGAAGYVRIVPGSCTSATKLSRVVGRRLIVATSCRRGQSFTLTYGPAIASTLAADGYVFLTQTRPTTGIVTTKTIKTTVRTKKGRRRTRLKRIRIVTKPTFRPLAPPKQPIVVVTGAPVDHLVINAPSIATSGTPFGITVRAEDVFGNVACCYTGTVSFSSSDPDAFLPTPYRFVTSDLGSKSFGRIILRGVGTQTISVSDDSGHGDASNPINVYPFPTG